MKFIGTSEAIGGIVGRINYKVVEECGNFGVIKGVYGIGGVAGYSNGGDIIKCFNKASKVEGTKRANNDSMIGGIVGIFISTTSKGGKIDSCYNLANVIGTRN